MSNTSGRSLLTGRRISLSPSARQWRRSQVKNLLRHEVARPGHNGARADGGDLYWTTSVHRWQTVWLHGWTWYHWHHHCAQAARKVQWHQQDTVHFFPRFGKGIRPCTQTCHLVGSSQADIKERLVRLIQSNDSMCRNARSRVCVAVAIWVKTSMWKWEFTKVPAWALYCSSRFWKPFPKSFVQDVPGKACMQMTWSASLNRWRNCLRSWSSGSLAWKEGQHG